MFTFDILDISVPQVQNMVQLAQAPEYTPSVPVAKTIYVGGEVNLSNADEVANGVDWEIANTACRILQYEKWLEANGLHSDPPKCVVSSVQKNPTHGKSSLYGDGCTYNYVPEPGFTGEDLITFIINTEGKKIFLIWPVNVMKEEVMYEGSDDSK